jgi:hypothetical protein
MMANIEYREGGRWFLRVGDPESGLHVNAALVRAGLARVDKPRFTPEAAVPLILSLSPSASGNSLISLDREITGRTRTPLCSYLNAAWQRLS